MESDVINTSGQPDGELVKEVYAHFGMCIYLSQVFETGLINILTALETAASKAPTRQTFDHLYAKHESLTFGNLMRALSMHGVVPDDLMQEVRELKEKRDHLAHRFFRDHNLDFVTVGGCYLMIERLKAHCDHFEALDQRISQIKTKALVKIGFDPDQIDRVTEQTMVEMLKNARPTSARSRGR